MCLQRLLVRFGGVFEGLPGEFVPCLVILLVMMIGRLPVSLRGSIMHLSSDLMGVFHGQRITGQAHRYNVLFISSNSSSVRGQSSLSKRLNARSASSFPPVWHTAQ